MMATPIYTLSINEPNESCVIVISNSISSEPFHIVQLILSENSNFPKFIILHNGKYNLIQSIKKPGNLDDSS